MPKNIRMQQFISEVWAYYTKNRRSMSWREEISPYRVLVSEIMLQQTQADRVKPKFESFMKRFPDWKTLAHASTKDVLEEWQGLGYNRRGLNLQRAAKVVVEKYNEKLPQTSEELIELPGIGPNTAGSIMAFAFNLPHPFIETNIRSVYIHHFFKDSLTKVHDKDILEKVTESLLYPIPKKNPREWYYALMDYGTYLKKIHKNPSRRSKHHKPQSKFKGSHRELRAYILKLLISSPLSYSDLISRLIAWRQRSQLELTPEQAEQAINELENENFIKFSGKVYAIAQ